MIDDFGRGYEPLDDAPFMTESLNRMPRWGERWEPAFLLTGETPRPGESPRAELARMLTGDIQFGRATVNLVWGKLMTVPFVTPYDGFDLARLDPDNPPPEPWTLQPTNPELLDALARDFMKKDYSVQHLIRTVLKSSTYQLSARFPGEWKDDYTPYYARKYVRLLTGPEVIDAITAVTGRPATFKFSGTTVHRVKELASPSDAMSRRGTGEGGEIGAIMQAFHQGNRSAQPPDGNTASTLQALLLTSTSVVNDRVLAADGSRVQELVDSERTDRAVVEELFLVNLSRWPTEREMRVALSALHDDRRRGAENVQWALLNSVEFVLNH